MIKKTKYLFLFFIFISFISMISIVTAYQLNCYNRGQSMPEETACNYDCCKLCLTDDGYQTLPQNCNGLSCECSSNPVINDTNQTSCTEAWTCNNWNACQPSNTQARTCTDSNSCGTTANKPAETESCTYSSGGSGGSSGGDSSSETCSGREWNCTPIGNCTNGLQNNTCKDVTPAGVCTTKKADKKEMMNCTIIIPKKNETQTKNENLSQDCISGQNCEVQEQKNENTAFQESIGNEKSENQSNQLTGTATREAETSFPVFAGIAVIGIITLIIGILVYFFISRKV